MSTTSLHLLVLVLPDLIRETPLPLRVPLITTILKSCCSGAGSPARPRPARFARALFGRALFANATLWRWYLQVRYLVGLTSAWQLVIADFLRLIRGLSPAPGFCVPPLVLKMASWYLRAHDSTHRAASRYLYAPEHIIRLYHVLFTALVFPFLPFLPRHYRQMFVDGILGEIEVEIEVGIEIYEQIKDGMMV